MGDKKVLHQEPVAWLYDFVNPDDEEHVIRDWVTTRKAQVEQDGGINLRPLYTAPPQREWQGLTDEEIEEGQKQSWVNQQAWQAAVWWAEDKLREKNS